MLHTQWLLLIRNDVASDDPPHGSSEVSRFVRRLTLLGLTTLLSAVVGVSCAKPPESAPIDAAASAGAADSVPTITAASADPLCPKCTIELDSMFSIGSPTDTVYPSGWPAMIVEGADHMFYVAPLSVEQKIGQYDRHGRLLAMFGGHGEEPGKYYAPGGIAASPDSMLLVRDINQVLWYRLDSLTAVHGPLDHNPNQGGLLAFRGRRFVATSSGGMPGELIYSDPVSGSTQLGVSASPLMSETDTEAQLRMWRVITGTDSLWYVASWWFEPLLDVWDRMNLVRRIRLPAPWYPPYSAEARSATMNNLTNRVLPATKSLWHDNRGLLWTITSVADTSHGVEADLPAEQATEQEILSGRKSPPSRPEHERFDAVVAAYQISDSTVRLIASQRFDPLLVAFLSDSVVAGSSSPEPGLTRFTLFKVRLRGYSP